MIRTFKRKLILNKAQSEGIGSWIGACRLVYNMGLEIKNSAYRNKGEYISNYGLQKELAPLRKEYDWIADVPSGTLINSLDRLDRSFKAFYKHRKTGAGFPRFATKKRCSSIGFKQTYGIMRVTKNGINLPKIGVVKMFKDSPIEGVIKTATIKREPTGYFICIQCENVPAKFVSDNQTIGLDMGLSHFCIDSNGGFIANPKHFKKHERQLRIENRSLARKKKGSNSWKKQAKKLSLLNHKIGNVRRDFLHKESTRIAKANSLAYVEDLNIPAMVKNRNLSRHILDAGWGMFRDMLGYKTTVVRVNPKYTSQTCNECGEVDKKSRLNQSEFVCTSCGHISNADVNAAKNILSRGTALDRKREPPGCALVLESPNGDMPATKKDDLANLHNHQTPQP